MLTAQNTNYQIKQYSETPLDDLLKEMSESREDFTNPEPKPESSHLEVVHDSSTADPDPVTKPPVTDQPPVDPKVIEGKRQFTAKMLAKYTDQGMAFLCALIADDDDTDAFKADADDKKDLIECYFDMCEGYGWVNMPPWLNLIFCIGFTYGPKMQQAFKERKVNQAITRKAAQAEAEQAIAERKLRDAQLENEKLKKEALVNKVVPDGTDARLVSLSENTKLQVQKNDGTDSQK